VRSPLLRCGPFLTAAVVLALGGCLASGSETTSPPLKLPATSTLPSSKSSHVVVLVMENKSYHDVIESGQSPYVKSLANRYALPASHYGIRHPSLPNYIAMIGGDTFGISSNCTSCHLKKRNLVDQLEGAGHSWRAYMQGMQKPCFKGSSSGGYAKKHDPFMYFDDIRNSSKRCHKVVPYERLAGDLKNGRLKDFSFITPDLCASTHDCPTRTGDRYLEGIVPALLKELGPRGILVITWDEGTSDQGCCGVAHGGRIATVVAGPDVRSGATGSGATTHYSTLRTVEDAFGLSHLRHAGDGGTRSLDALFSRSPHGALKRRAR
jgi:hypothetical protein